ncbi:MAG: hypothetical protein ACI9P5_004439 [Saprospiraceae bacterium]|jgi:hypothetical protein
MRLISKIILFCFLSISGVAQDGANPFEIQSRLDSIYQSVPGTESSTINVFDVVRSDDPTVTTSSALQKANSTTEESTIVPDVGEEDLSLESFNEQKAVANPFDVSHIPIRKSKLKKEANAFKPNSSTEKNTKKTKKGSNAFLFWLNLLTGFILAIVINTQRGALAKITKAITNENVLKLNHREEKKGVNGHYILLYFSYIVNAAIFTYLVLYNLYNQSGWYIFQLCFFTILLVYVVRHIFLSLISTSFPIQKEVSLYGFTIQSFNLFIGIVLMPLNLVIAFGPENLAVPLIYLTIVIIGLLIVLRSFRGLLISSRWISSNLFHFFLYLCAFEILPILLLIKVIGSFGIA